MGKGQTAGREPGPGRGRREAGYGVPDAPHGVLGGAVLLREGEEPGGLELMHNKRIVID